jgi:hypothetical protein
MANGWTLERRQRQAEAIKRWRPWEQSTGPVTPEGKSRVSRNAWKGGHRQSLLELSKMVNAEVRRARDFVTDCT